MNKFFDSFVDEMTPYIDAGRVSADELNDVYCRMIAILDEKGVSPDCFYYMGSIHARSYVDLSDLERGMICLPPAPGFMYNIVLSLGSAPTVFLIKGRQSSGNINKALRSAIEKAS